MLEDGVTVSGMALDNNNDGGDASASKCKRRVPFHYDSVGYIIGGTSGDDDDANNKEDEGKKRKKTHHPQLEK